MAQRQGMWHGSKGHGMVARDAARPWGAFPSPAGTVQAQEGTSPSPRLHCLDPANGTALKASSEYI